MPCIARFLLAALALCGSLAHAAGPTGRLNDTGQTQCDDGSNNMVACTASNTSDASTMPRQDARFGRDAAAAAGQLTKVGGGAAGFDFTALDANGNATTPGSHACVKDNQTKLIWSTETISNVTWVDAQTTATTYSHCGYTTGWRLPTRRELLSIVHHGASSLAIDSTYFPATQSDWYWSGDTYAPDPTKAWYVIFGFGNTGAYSKTTYPTRVRLVQSGQ